MKNIPLPRKESYIYKFIDKTERLLKRNKNCFTMKSRKCPLQVESMKGFEKDLTKMIKNIQFGKVSSAFLLKLDKAINNIKSSKKIYILANKTQKFNEIKNKDHEKILQENVTKTYQKSKPFFAKEDHIEAKEIAKEFNLDDKLNIMAKQQDFVTIKDHKPDFCNNPKY